MKDKHTHQNQHSKSSDNKNPQDRPDEDDYEDEIPDEIPDDENNLPDDENEQPPENNDNHEQPNDNHEQPPDGYDISGFYSILTRFDLNFKQLKSLIFFQTLYRKRRNDVATLKSKVENITNLIHSISMNIYHNHSSSIITHEYYLECMKNLNIIKNLVYKLPEINMKLYLTKKNSTSSSSSLFHLTWDKVSYIDYLCFNLLKSCGCSTIYDVLKFLINKDWNIGLRPAVVKSIKHLNTIFHIKTIQLKTIENFTVDTLPEICKNTNFTSSSIMKLYGAEVHLPLYSKMIILRGYFKPDHMNLIMNSNSYHEKLNGLTTELKNQADLNLINKNTTNTNTTNRLEFSDTYLKVLNIRDFLVLQPSEIIDLINDKYNEFGKFLSKPLSQVLEDYSNGSIEQKINLLSVLMCHEKGHNLAKSVISYQTANSTEQMHLISKNFSWYTMSMFLLLSKSIDVNQINLVITRDNNPSEVPYEERINTMKCDESIKRKAREKVKEIKNTREGNSKAVRYLDNLLNIPFNTYKKEKTLRFLSDFRKELFAFIDNSTLKLPESIRIMKKDSKIYTANSIGVCMDILLRFKNTFINPDKTNPQLTLNHSALLTPFLTSDKNLPEISDLSLDQPTNRKNSRTDTDALPIKVNSGTTNNTTNPINFTNTNTLIRTNSDLTLEEHDYLNLNSLSEKWENYKIERRQYMNTISTKLECIHGQADAKHKIKQIIGQWINGEMEGGIFGFNGPPGTGKTSLAKEGISSCLLDDDGSSRPFAFISLGGATNASFLEGHGYTYVDSKHGKIVDLLIESKCMNPIIYFDELDKVSNTAHGKEIMDLLIHITDPQQNEIFNDKYFDGIKIDLSKALIIFSYNDSDLIDPTLMNRITEVKFKSLNKNEKIHIGSNYLLPKILKSVGYTIDEIIFSPEVIEYLVESYIYEAGVRTLKEKLYELIREINIRNLDTDCLSFPISITKDLIDDVLEKKNRITMKTIHSKPIVGLVNGLYATTIGIGGITLIQVHDMLSETKFALELTGKLGDVMKESVRCAKTISWRVLPDLIKNRLIEEWKVNPYGLHIHFPSAGTPKDGPSAGITCCIGVISFLCKMPVRHYIAMTGEIDLYGNVKAIGGLHAKIEGAIRAGVKLVLIPLENHSDWDEIKNYYLTLKDFRVHLVSNINEVIEIALINKEGYQFICQEGTENLNLEQDSSYDKVEELKQTLEFIRIIDQHFKI